MKPTPAIVQPAVDLAALVNEWELLEGKEQRTVAEFKAAKTKLLIKARAGFNSRGDGFVDFVEKKLRMSFSTARDWMKAAGYVAPKQEGAGRKANHSESRYDSNDSGSTIAPSPKQPTPPVTRGVDDKRDEPQTAIATTASQHPARTNAVAWMARVEEVAEEMRRHGKALFAAAQELDAICAEHSASIASPTLMTLRSMLVGVKASVADTLKIMEVKN